MKDIKDYMHLYLGCEVKVVGKAGVLKWTMTAVQSDCVLIYARNNHDSRQATPFHSTSIKPILRPLSDMTEEEKKEAITLEARLAPLGDPQYSSESVRFWLSKHFDLFGLIEAGLAIDKTKIPA